MQQPLVSIGRNPAEENPPETYIDPVCKMLVTAETAAAKYEYRGETYYFCMTGCKEKFTADPDRFLSVPQAAATGGQSSPPYEGGVDAALGGRGGSLTDGIEY